MFSTGTLAPSNSTWPNSLVTPLIIFSGRCSIPGWCMLTMNAEMPLCLGTSLSSAGQHQAPVGDIGVTRPDLVSVDDILVAVADAVVVSDARSNPAPGSEKPWHHRSVPLIIPGRKRCRSSSLPW